MATAMETRAAYPTDVSIITTYRCQMQCKMCDIWENPSDSKREITAKELEMLPNFKFVNITGGEPFVRRDLEDIVEVMYKKAPRIVISTSGWHTDRIIKMAERFPNIGIRVSIEGLSQKNDDLRGREGSFDRAMRLLLTLKEMGIKDIGFGCTVSNKNSEDMLWLYKLSREMGLEFATASFHNSYYFHKEDNEITNKDEVINNFRKLMEELLKDKSPKSWYRAFFNLGLINYIRGNPRMLPCEAGTANFFIEPYGDVYPCNGLEDRYWKESMGNIRDVKTFDEIWFSEQAEKVRGLVRTCPKNCWMVGTAAPVMKKYIKHPTAWVVKNKIKSMLGKPICIDNVPHFDVGQDPLQGNLRESAAPEHKITFKRREPEVVLSEVELADMLRTD
ncbi:radical SAM protein [Methylotenera sp.]|uniref:radical SAM protein n=1 Tax=Methylotenera sp. TaxID=2051956 RepID=UPI002718BF9C|nr:radical SAM protein [Methylotenera sp.]MDO9204597.1 radical SAM protein [Methylotenera sp.]MDP2071273.1 radical SAM protein [Methylotenera sp.]MDP3005190.1 radical SAM protein [Methylotenera sp.]MDP3818092.1 radical SAM protein [Methylotenera sp.]